MAKATKAAGKNSQESFCEAYEDEGHTSALAQGSTGGCMYDDRPRPNTLLCDIPTSWSRPFQGHWPEQMIAEKAGSRELMETFIGDVDED